VPVDDPDQQARLHEVLDTVLADDVLAWQLRSDGTWVHVPEGGTVNTHLRLQELALSRTRRHEHDEP
jgi:polyphosphate kinase